MGRHIGGQGQPVVEPELATAVEDPDVLQAEQLQLPVGPGRKPVVVVAVEHDRRVVPDPALRQERLEILAGGDVTPNAVGELARPVPADRTRQVALLVGRGIDVDFHEADVGVVEVRLRPFGVDQGVLGCVVVVAHRALLADAA
jgi:hypothetical protein